MQPKAGAPPWLREIDHTGDVGIAVTAGTLETLFARAAWGMFSVLTEMHTVAPRRRQPLTVEAGDREALLVRWLSDLNFLHVTEGWLFCEFRIEALSDRRLVATAYGEPYDADRHPLYTEIKAVTFHDLSITRHADGWHVQVIFDM